MTALLSDTTTTGTFRVTPATIRQLIIDAWLEQAGTQIDIEHLSLTDFETGINITYEIRSDESKANVTTKGNLTLSKSMGVPYPERDHTVDRLQAGRMVSESARKSDDSRLASTNGLAKKALTNEVIGK